jgi:hypothetical protein
MRAFALPLLFSAACGASVVGVAARPGPGAACGQDETWDGKACRKLNAELSHLQAGERELADFRAKEAVTDLEQARSEGPYRHGEYARVYEQLSVAYAYLGQEQRALESFDMLLALRPGHAISYTLSPKATFVFEKARAFAAQRDEPRVRIDWPRELYVDRAVPLDVEVTSDPKQFLRRARVWVRKKGDEHYRFFDVSLKPAGDYQSVVVPPLAPEARSRQSLELFVTAYDGSGNEVLLWGAENRPREIPLAYQPPTPWYRKWWIWTAVGSAAAAGTGITVFALTRQAPDRVGGTVSLH